MNQTEDGHWYQAEFGAPFKNLPLCLMKRWWETTCYGKHPATNELMWTIEAIDPEAAEYIALGDAERTEQTMGEAAELQAFNRDYGYETELPERLKAIDAKQRAKKISDQTQKRAEEIKTLTTAMRSGAEDICADMVKVIMAWRRNNSAPPRWELPALMGLYKDFETSDGEQT
jgi:hypothetical protein